MHRVVYLTIGELISVPLIRRQVLEILVEMKKSCPSVQITLLSLISVVSYFRHRKEIRAVSADLFSRGVKVLVVPSPIPWPLPIPRLRKDGRSVRPAYVWTPSAAYALALFIIPTLLFLYAVRRVQIFHCRSYPSAYCVSLLKAIFPRVILVFDPRSDFPEENVTAGVWSEHSRSFLFWKSVEKRLVANAAATICIAKTYERAFKSATPTGTFVLIPNNVDTDRFVRSAITGNRIRHALGIASDEIVFCYLGELSRTGWHKPQFYRRAMEIFRSLPFKHRFLFLVPRNAAAGLAETLRVTGAKDKYDYFVMHPHYEEVPDYLCAADYGLMFLSKRKIAVGTKIGEYAACGLPVLSNANCLGALEVIDSYGVGACVNLGLGDLDTAISPNLSEMLKVGMELRSWQESVARIGHEHFGNRLVAARYLRIYADNSFKP